jgi:hypothetical protein
VPSGVVSFRQEWSVSVRSGQFPSGVVSSRQEWSVSVRSGQFPSGVVSSRQEWSVSVRSGQFPSGVISFRQEWSVSVRSGQFPSGVVSFRQEWSVSVRSGQFPSGVVGLRQEWSVPVRSGQLCPALPEAPTSCPVWSIGSGRVTVARPAESDCRMTQREHWRERGARDVPHVLRCQRPPPRVQYASHGGSVHREWACDRGSPGRE